MQQLNNQQPINQNLRSLCLEVNHFLIVTRCIIDSRQSFNEEATFEDNVAFISCGIFGYPNQNQAIHSVGYSDTSYSVERQPMFDSAIFGIQKVERAIGDA